MSLESVFRLSLIMNLIDNLTGPMAGVTSSVDGTVSKLQKVNSTLGSVAKTGAVMQEVGSQITGAVLSPVEATFETRRAIGELASLGVKDLGAVEDAAREFSDQWAGTTKADFIAAAYDIKSGIATLSDEGVAEFTSLAALTAKATKSTAGEMTSLFATGYGIYKGYYDDMSDLEFGEMFSAGIAKSVQQFKTTGSEMASSIESLGASATNANVPLEEQLTILGMLQGTMSGSEAGTKYAAFIQSAAKGGEELGLSFLDANNQLKSLPEILDQLRGKYGDTIDAMEKQELASAFGTDEAVDLIDLLYNKTEDLQGNILTMYDALGSGTGVATEMANAINETEPERFERLTQRIQNVKESIGNSLLPTINDLMSTGEQVLTKVGSWVEENQELVRVIMLVVLAIGGFLTIRSNASPSRRSTSQAEAARRKAPRAEAPARAAPASKSSFKSCSFRPTSRRSKTSSSSSRCSRRSRTTPRPTAARNPQTIKTPNRHRHNKEGETTMIYTEDQIVKVNGVVLPGLVKSIEVKESAQIDEQEVEGSATKPKQATGYEDAKVNIELILDDTPTQTKYQRLETLRAIFRTPGQSVPKPLSIVSEDTAAHGVDKVLFKGLTHKMENKKEQLTVSLEFWEYVPQTIQTTSSSSGSSSGGGSSGGSSGGTQQQTTLSSDYQKYLQTSRGKSPAVDDASTAAALDKVSQMPY